MQSIRQPAVAGTFYPKDTVALTTMVDELLGTDAAQQDPSPKALIAPHAGYIYSGGVAASAYRDLDPTLVRQVVLLGPAHRVAFNGMALPTVDAFRTPLGDIPINKDAINLIKDIPGVGYLDDAHAKEHSLEVHLPFLQRQLNEFSLLPIVVGKADKETVATVLQRLWGGRETLIVISSDLSHFHDYDKAQKLDAATASKIRKLDASLQGHEACGCRPVNGLLHLAKQHGLQLNEVEVLNSGDTAGDKARVVGYGAWKILDGELSADKRSPVEPPAKMEAQRSMKPLTRKSANNNEFDLAERQQMLQLAREAIRAPLDGETNLNIRMDRFPEKLKQDRATFVTLNINGKLRGCIGSLQAHRGLLLDIAQNAQAAAFKDPRFTPLASAEYPKVDIHLSILTPPQLVEVNSREALREQLRPGIDGLILKEGQRQATYLPSVWKQINDPEQFIANLRIKAGLAADGWSNNMSVYCYQTEEFS